MLRTKTDSVVPLKSQNVNVSIRDRFAGFTLEQNYLNVETTPVEAYFTFPTPTGVSVFSFEAKNDEGKVIKCVLKEKEQAKKDYNKAIKDGDTAFYVDRTSGDVFNVAVGNLAPNSGVTLTLKFVVELDNEVDNRHLRLNIPLTLMSRYTPSYSGNTYRSHNPPKTVEKPYSQNVSGDIVMTDGIESVESKTHKIKLSQMREHSVHFDIEDLEALNKDIVITIERKSSKTGAHVQKFQGELKDESLRYCTTLNIVPDFSKMPPVNVNNVHYMILLDKSGSMEGKDIENCRTAAQNFVAFLPTGSTFDVYAFDSTFKKFENASTDINQRKVAASEWISRIEADGGTEILPVLNEIYAQLKKSEKIGVMIVLSDGGVSNVEDVMRTVRNNPNVSVYTIGIGSNVSQELIKGLAQNGNGMAEFIGSGDRDIVQKVREQLKRSQASLRKLQNDYSIDYNLIGGSHREVPMRRPALYEGNDNTLYLFSEFEPAKISYTEKVVQPDGSVQELAQEIIPEHVDNQDCVFHRVAALKLMDEIQHSVAPSDRSTNSGSKMAHMHVDSDEQDAQVKAEIIKLSIDMNVLSKYTAFIGVEVRDVKVTGEAQLREVPLQLVEKESYESVLECAMVMPMSKSSAAFSLGATRGGGMLKSMAMPRSFGASRGIAKSMSYDDEEESDECMNLGGDPAMDIDSVSPSKGVFNQFVGFISGSSNSNKSQKTSKKSTPAKQITPTLVLSVALNGTFMVGGLIVGPTNGSLEDVLRALITLSVQLKVGDVIQLTAENNTSHNGFYEITCLGTKDEPYVLQRVQ